MEILLSACREEIFGDGSLGFLTQGDAACLDSDLLRQYEGTVQCVYIDPPFFTGQDFFYRPEQNKNLQQGYTDRWASLEEYLSMMRAALCAAHRVMRQDGLIFVHVDYRVCAHMRLLLDEVFGGENFLNEIVWHYRSGGRTLKHFARKHDTIFLYAKGRNYFFDIRAAGTRRGARRRNNMKRSVDETGRTYYSIRSMGKEYRYFEDDLVFPDDVWEDISHLQQRDPERTGYDTQKPEKLLRRIVACASREGDLVADFFCGSGTTAAVAHDMNRRFLALDVGSPARLVSRRRLAFRGASFRTVCGNTTGAQPSIKLTVRQEQDETFIFVDGYCMGEGEELTQEQPRQLGFADVTKGQTLRFGDKDPKGPEQLLSVAGGYVRDGVFRVGAFQARGKRGLETALVFGKQPGVLAVRTEDVLGHEYLFKIISN
ncbi:MAG: DNA methyltransferase [Christensenellales bacterium]|jgi:DNA modification methylase